MSEPPRRGETPTPPRRGAAPTLPKRGAAPVANPVPLPVANIIM